MKIDNKRLHLLLYATLGLGTIIFIAIMVLGNAVLKQESKKMVELKSETRATNEQIDRLNQVKIEVEKYKYFNDVARSVIPNDKDEVQAVADIFKMASDSGFLLQNITFPSSTLGGPAAATTAPAGSSASSSSSTVPSASTQATPTAAKNSISQAKPVSGITGLYSVEIAVTPQVGGGVSNSQQVNYPKLVAFLDRIEHNRRTAQITQISIQPQNGQFNFQLTLNLFIKP